MLVLHVALPPVDDIAPSLLHGAAKVRKKIMKKIFFNKIHAHTAQKVLLFTDDHESLERNFIKPISKIDQMQP